MDINGIISEEIEKLLKEAWYDEEQQFDDYEPRLSDRITAKLGIRDDNKNKFTGDSKPKTMGELFGFITYRGYSKLVNPIALYKNPITLEGFGKNAKGILFENGDFYLTESSETLHYNVLQFLSEKGLVSHTVPQTYDNEYPKEFVAVEREGSANVFGQSSAYDYIKQYYIDMFKSANLNHNYKFKMAMIA